MNRPEGGSPHPASLRAATLSRPTGEGLGVRAVHWKQDMILETAIEQRRRDGTTFGAKGLQGLGVLPLAHLPGE